MNYNLKKRMAPAFFLAPFLIIFVVFTAYPILYSIVLSFAKYRSGQVTFLGLRNYQFILGDQLFWQSVLNTFTIMIMQAPIMIILAIILATILNSALVKLKGAFRMLLFLPVLIDAVSYSIVFSMFFNADGFVNSLLNVFGIPDLSWYTVGTLAQLVIVIAVTWKWTGYNAIILLSGLQNIPAELYEAAFIDGANTFQKFMRITIPELKPIILFTTIMSVNGSLQMFTEPNLLTHGGPVNLTSTIVLYLYNIGFKNFNFGVAASGSYILAFMIAVLTYIQLRVTREE